MIYANAYVNLVASMSQTDADANTGVGVYNYETKYLQGGVNHDLPLPNVALVKNARMTSDKYPILEDIRRVDILRTQLNQYADNLDDEAGIGYRKLYQNVPQGNIKVGAGLELHREGTLKSSVNDVNIQIPLKDIFELGKSDNLPCDKLGACRIHLEMNFDRLAVSQLQGAGKRTGTEFGEEYYTEFENSAVAGGDLGITEAFKTKNAFADIKNSPYYVGQKLRFTGTKEQQEHQQVLFNVDTIITSINRITTAGADEGKLEILTETRLN